MNLKIFGALVVLSTGCALGTVVPCPAVGNYVNLSESDGVVEVETNLYLANGDVGGAYELRVYHNEVEIASFNAHNVAANGDIVCNGRKQYHFDITGLPAGGSLRAFACNDLECVESNTISH